MLDVGPTLNQHRGRALGLFRPRPVNLDVPYLTPCSRPLTFALSATTETSSRKHVQSDSFVFSY